MSNIVSGSSRASVREPRPAASSRTPPGARRPAVRRGPQDPSITSRIVTVSGLCVALAYFLLPVYWLAVASTKSSADLFGTFGFWFTRPQLIANLRTVFTYDDSIYVKWIMNSALYAGVGATVATLIAAAGGYGLAKFSFRGRETAFNIVLAGVLIPSTALALPLYLLFSELHLANTYWSVLLPSFVSPFGVYLCRIYAHSAVPDELLEAARIDGAGEVRTFLTVALRLMRPVLITIFLFQFVGVWNNYFLPLVMLSDQRLYPVTLGLASWLSYTDRVPMLYQAVVGGALVSAIPLMIAMLVLQRFWRTGLTEGSSR